MAECLSLVGASITSAVCLVGARSTRTLLLAAALTAATRSSDASSRNCFKPSFGLVMMLTAPAASAAIEVSAPDSASVEQMTTGVGRSDMIFFRNVMPSMRGISMSSTITSGHCACMRAMARIGSATAAMTSMSGSRVSKDATTCRTTAESSTTITLIRVTSIAPVHPIQQPLPAVTV